MRFKVNTKLDGRTTTKKRGCGVEQYLISTRYLKPFSSVPEHKFVVFNGSISMTMYKGFLTYKPLGTSCLTTTDKIEQDHKFNGTKCFLFTSDLSFLPVLPEGSRYSFH